MDTKKESQVGNSGESSVSTGTDNGHAKAPGTSQPRARKDYAQADKTSPGPPSRPTHFDLTKNPRADLPPDFSLAEIFRYHMGIAHDEKLVPPHLAQLKAIDPIETGQNKGRRAVNLGIYNRAIREEQSAHKGYWIWSFVINLALSLQIIFAAILTALGAGKGPPDAVAVFGALNTIIAGFLTYLKGTGLPMRMKYFYNQWLKLRMYIEQRERDFASDDFSRVHRFGYEELMDEIYIVEQMYSNIRKDIERHEPDSFSGKGDDNKRGPGEGAPPEDLANKGVHAKKHKLRDAASSLFQGGQHEAEGRLKGAMADIENQIHDRISKLEGHVHGPDKNGKANAQVTSEEVEQSKATKPTAGGSQQETSELTPLKS